MSDSLISPIADRWSARGYDAEAVLPDADLRAILEAGRWAPTWGRIQPVRFVVGVRGDKTFDALTETLNRGNKTWAPAAMALILLTTTNTPDDEKPHEYGPVDLGLALGQMSMQAVAMGYNAHPIAGFDPQAAREAFAVPADARPMVILAVGALASDPAALDPEIVERDGWERTRLPLSEIAFSGVWGTSFDHG